MRYAKQTNGESIIICDRGALDGSAFIPESLFQKLMDEINETRVSLLNRYDAIFHMTSVAVDLQQRYENISNIMRRENTEQAIEIDAKLLEIWKGHPCRIVFDNSTGLEEKVTKVFESMKQYIEKEKGENIR